MYGCNYCVELNVSSGYMCFPDLSYRFPIVIDMFPTDMFRSRYPVISVPFSRPFFPFPFPFLAKKNRNRNGLGVFPTVPDRFQTRPTSRCAGRKAQNPFRTTTCKQAPLIHANPFSELFDVQPLHSHISLMPTPIPLILLPNFI